jgi:hypothetical protein
MGGIGPHVLARPVWWTPSVDVVLFDSYDGLGLRFVEELLSLFFACSSSMGNHREDGAGRSIRSSQTLNSAAWATALMEPKLGFRRRR